MPEEKTTAELAYTAGLFDGEGCIYFNKRLKGHHIPQLFVTVTNTDLDVLYWLKETYGGSVSRHTKGTLAHKESWSWAMGGNPMSRAFLGQIVPYLKIKRLKAIRAISPNGEMGLFNETIKKGG